MRLLFVSAMYRVMFLEASTCAATPLGRFRKALVGATLSPPTAPLRYLNSPLPAKVLIVPLMRGVTLRTRLLSVSAM